LEELEIHTKFELENLKGRDNLGNLGVDGRILIKFILNK
jgi:hypothetical protein